MWIKERRVSPFVAFKTTLEYLGLLNCFCLCFVLFFSLKKTISETQVPFTSLQKMSSFIFWQAISEVSFIFWLHYKRGRFPSVFFSILSSIVYLLFIKTIFCRLKVLFFFRQVIFSLECFSRQGPEWSALTSKSCVMMPHWKGRAELYSGQSVIIGPRLNCFREIGFAP